MYFNHLKSGLPIQNALFLLSSVAVCLFPLPASGMEQRSTPPTPKNFIPGGESEFPIKHSATTLYSTLQNSCHDRQFCLDVLDEGVMTNVSNNVTLTLETAISSTGDRVYPKVATINLQPSDTSVTAENLSQKDFTSILNSADITANVAIENPQQIEYFQVHLEEKREIASDRVQIQNPLSPTTIPSNETDLTTLFEKISNSVIQTNRDRHSQTQQTPDREPPIPLTSPATQSILTPKPGEVLEVPATTIIVQFPKDTETELLVNGKPVSRDLIGRSETDSSTGIITQTWYGVPLEDGENTIALKSKNGETSQSPVTVFVQGAPAEIAVETLEARIPADGRSVATIQGQLLDENGQLVKREAIVTLSASAGEFIGADYSEDQPGFQVQAIAGEYTAQLRAPFDAQTGRIRAATEGADVARAIEAFTQIQFETYLRPSIVTGAVNFRFGRRGTDYWGSFRDFLPPDEDYDYEVDLYGAAFATGKIGGWLFTGAWNSDRALNCDCYGNDDRLFSDTQFSEQNYPIYGDASTTQAIAPSSDSVFLRFERSSTIEGAGLDYFMWGDYSTVELSSQSQEYTALTRALHGFKGNYNFGPLQITGVYANDVEGFQRDAIAPDGTSGYYFLSRRFVIPGSENIFLELEEIGRPGNIVRRQQLNRGEDYEIDYDRGSLLFRRPILRTDVVTVNGVEIVVARRIISTYQHEDREGDTNLWGGRVQYNFLRDYNTPSWLGATYVRQNQGIRDFELYGADFMLSFGNGSSPYTVTNPETPIPNPETRVPNFTSPFSGQFIAEYAHSSNDSELLGLVSGEAYRMELNAAGGPLSGRLYYRNADNGFANDATISFVPGQTRYGAQLTGRLTNTTLLQLSYDHEENFGNAPRPITVLDDFLNPRTEAIPGNGLDNTLTTISAGLQQSIGRATLGLDWVWRNRTDDEATRPLDVTSSQLRSRFYMPITEKIAFRAQNEFNLSDDEDAVYPDRTILGLDWQLVPGVTLQLNQVWFTGGQFDENSITSVNLNGDYNLTDDTVLTGRYSFINGETMGAALGIQHGWTVFPGFRLNLAYEHVFGSLFSRTGAGSEFAQPYAPGQSAAALGIRGGDSYSIGFEYTGNPDFAASARYEHRFSSSGDNTVIAGAVTGKLTESLSVLGRYQQASSSNQLFEDIGDTINLRTGIAYRNPNNDKFNALLRYEFRQNASTIPETILFDSGTKARDHTLALESIYAPNWRWEFYGKYALRHSTSFLADDLVGTSMVSLAQLRATYRLGYRWDIMGEGRWIAQPNAEYNEFGIVAELGFYITPELRLSAGYVFGKVSDRDFDGDRSASGPYLGLSLKLNQLWPGFGQDIPRPAAPPSGVESVGGEE